MLLPERRGSKGAITAISGALPCKDAIGHQQSIAGSRNKFVEWVNVANSGRFVAGGRGKPNHDATLSSSVSASWPVKHGKNDLFRKLQKRPFPLPPYRRCVDLVDDPQLKARGFLRGSRSSQFGTLILPRSHRTMPIAKSQTAPCFR
jgi:crotonobetainyl-CoA:carnitine CoA-transferase CaiB-like acyl-CoA transferase